MEDDGWDSSLLVVAARRRRTGPPAHTAPHASGLHADLERQLDAVHRMFAQWHEEAGSNRTAAMAVRPFPSTAAFDAALLVFNHRGERRSRVGEALQDYYFAPRRRATRVNSPLCHRCTQCLPRRSTFFVDVAKPWRQADEMCALCMQWVLRSTLGDDDAAIMAEAAALLDWSPRIDVALAEALLHNRRFFS